MQRSRQTKLPRQRVKRFLRYVLQQQMWNKRQQRPHSSSALQQNQSQRSNGLLSKLSPCLTKLERARSNALLSKLSTRLIWTPSHSTRRIEWTGQREQKGGAVRLELQRAKLETVESVAITQSLGFEICFVESYLLVSFWSVAVEKRLAINLSLKCKVSGNAHTSTNQRTRAEQQVIHFVTTLVRTSNPSCDNR